ncbi:MAG: transporter permease, partial [Rhodoferax sp.]|nr:transporter permease [Rhodoferax sp.]
MRKISPFIWFIVPAIIVIVAVIVFPWLFTLWMSLFDWKIGSTPHFAGLSNYAELATNQRFLESIAHTLIFTALAVA